MAETDFRIIAPRIDSLQKHWQQELAETHRRRLVRHSNDSVLRLRETGAIKPHETHIPRRICDSNIRREQPARINYISQSRDLAKFRPLTKLPDLPIEALEREFTEFGQYPGWQMPLFQTVDGASTHGWDAIEVLFDISKPGHFYNRHIGHEYLWFSPDLSDIQEAPLAPVIYGASLPQLDEYVDSFGFKPEQVDHVRKALKAQEDAADSKVRLFKVYIKEGNVVWVGWHSEYCRDWLKTPERLYLGIIEKGQQRVEKKYPIKVLRYDISENELITEIRGRVFRDEHDQEAMTQATTALINRLIVSSWVLFTRKDPTEGVGEQQTEMKLKNGAIVDPGSFFSLDPPDPGLFSAIMALLNLNSNEANQVNYAAMNRKDSRKTAKEMDVAENQAAQLSAVDVMLLSLFLQETFTLDWDIFRSQVLQEKIISALPAWKQYYEGQYILMPSGDSDVIRRQEINAAMKQDWPVMQTTGAAEAFLADLLRASPYAENAEKYITAMVRGNQKDDLILGMKNAIETLAVDPKTGQLQPWAKPFAPQLKELQVKFQQVMDPEGEAQTANEPATNDTGQREAA